MISIFNICAINFSINEQTINDILKIGVDNSFNTKARSSSLARYSKKIVQYRIRLIKERKITPVFLLL